LSKTLTISFDSDYQSSSSARMRTSMLSLSPVGFRRGTVLGLQQE